MSELNIPISSYKKVDNLVDIRGQVIFDQIPFVVDIPLSKSISLFNYNAAHDLYIIPRNYECFRLNIMPVLATGFKLLNFIDLLIEGENPFKILKLRVQVTCKSTRWCSNQLIFDLSEIEAKCSKNFDIPMSEVRDDIIVSAFITREKSGAVQETRKARAIYSVVSECDPITIQIDERKEIGSNHLPIQSEEIGDLVFDIHGMDNDFDLPIIKYSIEFDEYFKRDNLMTVNISFMMASFYFLDSYLKWLVFKCKYDLQDKLHIGLIDLFSRYCSVSKPELVEIVEDVKFSENQTRKYYSLSQKLLAGIQINSGLNYKSEIKRLIKNEMK